MKKIFILLFLLFILFFIYNKSDNKMNYVSIGDNTILGINSYNMRIMGFNDYVKSYLNKQNKLNNYNNLFYNNTCNLLLNDIKSNKTIVSDNHTYYIKKVLRESNVVILSCGMEEMFNNDINIDSFINNYDKLLYEINRYSLYKTIVLGFYNKNNSYDSNSDSFYYYLNTRCKLLCDKYNFIYIDLYELIKQNKCIDGKNYLLNSQCNLKIAELILEYI